MRTKRIILSDNETREHNEAMRQLMIDHPNIEVNHAKSRGNILVVTPLDIDAVILLSVLASHNCFKLEDI